VLFEWKAYPHVNLSDSYALPIVTRGNNSAESWDFFHINSIDKDEEGLPVRNELNSTGNYLISSRHYCALYYINGKSEDIIWQLNGKRSNFTMGMTLPSNLIWRDWHALRIPTYAPFSIWGSDQSVR
jgi:hypothetical protein